MTDTVDKIAAEVLGLQTIREWSDGRATDEQWANLHGDIQDIVTWALTRSDPAVRERVTDEMVDRACTAAASTYAAYPDRDVSAPLSDWFDLNAQDAVDFKVLHTPEWHYYSDIRGEQFEQYIAAVLREPIRAALTAALTSNQEGNDEA